MICLENCPPIHWPRALHGDLRKIGAERAVARAPVPHHATSPLGAARKSLSSAWLNSGKRACAKTSRSSTGRREPSATIATSYDRGYITNRQPADATGAASAPPWRVGQALPLQRVQGRASPTPTTSTGTACRPLIAALSACVIPRRCD